MHKKFITAGALAAWEETVKRVGKVVGTVGDCKD